MAEVFTAEERNFLAEHPIGRLATLTADGAPVVVPVGFGVERDGITVVGHGLVSSAKWRNLGRDPRFSFVVDDGVGRDARGLQVRGEATRGDAVIRLIPRRIVTWGIVTDPFQRHVRDL